MRGFGWLVLCLGCSSSACGGTETPRPPHVGRTGGGAVALSYDERLAVVTNRNAGVVSVLTLKPERGLNGMVTRTEALELELGSEPWAAVIGADDDTAYVVLRHAREVVRIDHLKGQPVVADTRVRVGSEPSGIAITPTGKMLFVANSGDGTITMIDALAFEYRAELDLNESLVKTGVLGDIAPRQGLAHPRALTITDDGDQDDEDERLYATEFFSQPMPEKSRDLDVVDQSRQGFVYSLKVASGQKDLPLPISPLKSTGFLDSNGEDRGCFPNQLQAVTVDHGRLFVTAMCTSPAGPLDRATPEGGTPNDANYKTLLHPAVFVADLETREETPQEARLLTRVLEDAYAADGNDSDVRMPLIPNEIAFHGDTRTAYVLALGADAVFRLAYDGTGALREIGSPGHRYVGSLPENGYAIGLAISQRSSPSFGLALSDGPQQISIMDLARDSISKERLPSVVSSERAQLRESPENVGRGLFASGRGVWSYRGQAWSSCESCHPGGGSDGVTWYFARGPRRTLSTINTYEKRSQGREPNRRVLLWGANVDEVHDVEGIVRSVSGGSGAVIWQYSPEGKPSNDCRIVYDGKAMSAGMTGLCQAPKRASTLLNGLNGALSPIIDAQGCSPASEFCDSSIDRDWNYIDAFIRSLRVPAPPSGLDATRIGEGRKVFERARCAECHGGPLWTVSTLFYQPSAEENGSAPGTRPSAVDSAARLLGKLRRDVYNVPLERAYLNPAADLSKRQDCKPGTRCQTLRVSPSDESSATVVDFLYSGQPAAADDQLQCALRNVGTFPAQGFDGVVPTGQPAPRESRSQSDAAIAQGANGYGVPSLFGLGSGAPYFHAGNARTLEEVFDSAFVAHTQSIVRDLKLDAEEQRNLIEFLLSLNELSVPFTPTPELDFCRAREPR